VNMPFHSNPTFEIIQYGSSEPEVIYHWVHCPDNRVPRSCLRAWLAGGRGRIVLPGVGGPLTIRRSARRYIVSGDAGSITWYPFKRRYRLRVKGEQAES
jgi:hypothetical protein